MNTPINQLALHYDKVGTGEPLILVGGLTANAREWQSLLPYLQDHFTVYMPENRGAGQTSGWTDEFTIHDMADDLAQFIAAQGLGSVNVLGHSMGGAIVQCLCIQHPHCVKAAMIASSFAKFPKAAQLYIENTPELIAAGLPIELVLRSIYTRLYGSRFLSDAPLVSSELQRMLNDPFPQTPAGYQAQVKAIAKFDTRAELGQISCPVFIIHGTEDVLTPSHLSQELHQKIKNSTLHGIPECGHMLPQENPEALAHYILRTLSPSPDKSEP